MSEIEEAVAKAIAAEVETGPVSYDALHYSYEKAKADYHCLARAAIEAYEAAKMSDLMAGMLTHEISADGVVNYVERDKMLEKSRQTNKWMSDAINRLAERKP